MYWVRFIIDKMSVSDVAICEDAYNGNLLSVRGSIAKDPSLVSQTDKNMRTPLHWACSSGQAMIVRLLIDNGAQVCVMHL